MNRRWCMAGLAAVFSLVACTNAAPSASAPSILPSTALPTPAPATSATALLTHIDEGFSLRYPVEYHVVIYGRSMCLSLAPGDGPPGAYHVASAFIDVRDAAGLTLATAADSAASQGNPDIPVTRTDIEIGGEAGILLDDIYAFDVLRKVVILHNDRVYELTFVHTEGTPSLFSTVTETLTFLDR